MPQIKDISNNRYGRLVAKERAYINRNHGWWICKCDCGKEIIVSQNSLQTGNTKSCGCLRKELTKQRGKSNITHGGSHSKLYDNWRGIIKRCFLTGFHCYKRYGGRGISVCDEWTKFDKFQEWALKNGYDEHLTIDRIDNNGNYEPSNCRWATRKEQARNKRNTTMFSINGIKKPLIEWSEILGVKYATSYDRFHNNKPPFKQEELKFFAEGE
jgi:hypothetical protein